ncbi:MAG: hypothetical protein R3C05_26610 [Pirellulaceae bacterium]
MIRSSDADVGETIDLGPRTIAAAVIPTKMIRLIAASPSHAWSGSDSVSENPRLRQGGLGQVFVALDEELNVTSPQANPRSLASNDDARQRFMLEAEITGGLEHPGVVPVYGLGVRRR